MSSLMRQIARTTAPQVRTHANLRKQTETDKERERDARFDSRQGYDGNSPPNRVLLFFAAWVCLYLCACARVFAYVRACVRVLRAYVCVVLCAYACVCVSAYACVCVGHTRCASGIRATQTVGAAKGRFFLKCSGECRYFNSLWDAERIFEMILTLILAPRSPGGQTGRYFLRQRSRFGFKRVGKRGRLPPSPPAVGQLHMDGARSCAAHSNQCRESSVSLSLCLAVALSLWRGSVSPSVTRHRW